MPQQQAEAPAASGAVAPHRPTLRQLQTFPPRSFDVVVDTFGLCSQQDPVTALKVRSVAWWGQGGGAARMHQALLCKLLRVCGLGQVPSLAHPTCPTLLARCRKWRACASRVAASCCCSTARAPGGSSTMCWTTAHVRMCRMKQSGAE